MKLYLLDSTPVAAYLHGREAVIDLVKPWIIRRAVATSILVYAEVTEYIKGLPIFLVAIKTSDVFLVKFIPTFLLTLYLTVMPI
jgi:hypothetical protein